MTREELIKALQAGANLMINDEPFDLGRLKPVPELGPVRVHPNPNAFVYWVEPWGQVNASRNLNDPVGAMAQGNLFATRDAANHEVKRRAVVHKLWCQPGAEVWERGKPQYPLEYGSRGWRADSYAATRHHFHLPYFATGADAEAAIEALGDELNVLLEG